MRIATVTTIAAMMLVMGSLVLAQQQVRRSCGYIAVLSADLTPSARLVVEA
jgi:hypothetical protein